MKKLILSAVTTVLFTSTIAMADEFFVGGGYDFYRKSSEKNIKNKKLKQGIKIKYAPFFYSSCMGFKYGSHLSSFHRSQYLTSYDSRRLDDPIREVRRGFACHTLNPSALLTG